MKRYKRVTAGILLASSLVSLSGCAVSFGEDATSYPLVPELTVTEVNDYYKESLSFDAVISKNLDIQETTYETTDVTDPEKVEQLAAALGKTIGLLGQMEYRYSAENALALDEATFHYIKSYLNDKTLVNRTVSTPKQALGYYFIDVAYDIQPRSIGTFTDKASLLGLNGAFIHSDYYNSDSVNTAYLTVAVQKLNDYYADNGILDKRASFNSSTGLFSTDPTATSTQPDYSTSTATDGGGTGGAVDAVSATSASISNRHPNIDISTFNTLVGSSDQYSAYFPDLEMVYNIPEAVKEIPGIGIYPCGAGGLTKFGFNRSQLTGTVTLRFVYKDDLVDSSILHNVNVYPVFSEITSGFTDTNEQIIPDFLMEEFETLIDRADRAIINCDLPGLMSGNIYSDMGMAVLRGYENNYVNVLRQISTVRRVVSRDVENGAYLLEVESIRQEGPKGADVYGTYRDMSYVVIEQDGQDFVITDWITMNRKMQEEPSITPDSAVAKRLVALNLAGPVSDEAKESVTQLLNNLYTAGTYRVLTGPYDVDTPEGTKTIEVGMYDCFNRNVEMLSQNDFNDINTRLRAQLTKHGINTSSTYRGKVTEWIGGASNQVELITEEVITYQGSSEGTYMQVYYLCSNMEDKWVIDDIQFITVEDHSGEDLQADIDRISSK